MKLYPVAKQFWQMPKLNIPFTKATECLLIKAKRKMLISNSGRSEIFSEGMFISACTPLLLTTFAAEQNA